MARLRKDKTRKKYACAKENYDSEITLENEIKKVSSDSHKHMRHAAHVLFTGCVVCTRANES